MPTPGPWIQPADPLRFVSTHLAHGGWDIMKNGIDRAAVESGTSFDNTTAAGASGSAGLTHYFTPPTGFPPWAAQLGLTRLWASTASRAPVPPTPAELAAPHVVGYEYEGGPSAQSVIVGPISAAALQDGAFGTPTVFDPADLALIAGEIRLLDPAYFTFNGAGDPVPGSWIPASDVSALPLLTSIPYLAPDFSSWPFTLPWTGVDPVALVTTNYWVNGTDFSTPPSSGNDLFLNFGPDWSVGVYVHPPRYRLLYDVVPQRQFPRDDGLAISTSRSYPQRTSRQFSPRTGPAGTYL